MSSFETESAQWREDVDAEAARLVRLGVPPWDAMIQARQRIIERRRREAAIGAQEGKDHQRGEQP